MNYKHGFTSEENAAQERRATCLLSEKQKNQG